ncbi:MAG: hypothetical protein CMD74_02595 [Gammaproteobacteria bacterium]|nr:hypothetical protein [Gammaproteobacteria bacterium]|tara:strand:+ start:168 stop:515 length:348 start_codon:yes stop_codon:yes gene_type:complete
MFALLKTKMPFRTIPRDYGTPSPPPTIPTSEQWKEWDELDRHAARLGETWREAVKEQMKRMKNNASSVDIKIAGVYVVNANAACNLHYEKQVKWSQKFGFQNFEQLLSMRATIKN